MRALTRYLGPIRELDVELDILEDESKTDGVPGRAHRNGAARGRVAGGRRCARSWRSNAPVGDLKKLLKKLERVGSREEGRGQREEAKKGKGQKADAQERSAMARRARDAADAPREERSAPRSNEAGPLYAPERIHDVRIATKKLRYALEIAHDAGVPRRRRSSRSLKRQQERLGRLHDLQMLLKHVREAEASPRCRFARERSRRRTPTRSSASAGGCTPTSSSIAHELAGCVKDVRHQLVPALTTPPRRQARVAGAARAAVRPRRARDSNGDRTVRAVSDPPRRRGRAR